MLKYAVKLLLFFTLCLGVFVANGQVTAGFTASDTAGCAPIIVNFINTSTGATSYSWDLGNGVTTSATDASASYTTAGTYTVTLTASKGGSSSVYKMVIKAIAAPTVSFNASNTGACPGTPVTYTSTSVANAPGPLSYIWNFGDGSSSTATSPTYTYTLPGNYNVTLFATNSAGCINSLGKTGYVDVFTPAVAGFNAATTSFCKPPATASFTNTTSGSGPFSYVWIFGDGGSSSGTSPSHTYAASGTYDVKLIETDGNGCKDSFTQAGYINVESMSPGFTPVANGCMYIADTFRNTSSPHISCTWDFGDGSTSTDDNGIHAFMATGIYSVKLVVFNGTCYDSVTHTINISKPTGSFSVSQPCAPPYSVLNFTASTAAGNTVNWLFGDDSTGTGNITSHTYFPFNFHPVSINMILTNTVGCKDTVVTIDTIRNLWLAFIGTSLQSGCVPLTVTFTGNPWFSIFIPTPYPGSIDPFPYPYPISNYLWNFGDGSPTSTLSNPVHVFTAVGIYTITCHAVTANGCTADSSLQVMVGFQQNASFTASPRHVCDGQPITFTSTSTSASLIDNYWWDFADGGKVRGSGEKVVTYKPIFPYTYPQHDALTVFYRGCASAPFYLTDTADAPNASLVSGYACIPDNRMVFGDSSVGDDTHLWQFGDGVTTTAANPIHDFPALTTYTVTLTTYNATTGCRDTAYMPVDLAKLSATVTPYHASICRDAIDTITTAITAAGSKYAVAANWYINGTLTDVDSPKMDPMTVDSIHHSLHTRGVDSVILVLADNNGCFDTFGTNIIVAKPIDNFSFTPSSGCVPLPVHFTDLSADVSGVFLSRYYWSFGDNDTAGFSIPTTNHTYTAAGSYTVEEIVTDNIGCKDTLTSPTHIVADKPVAAFSASTTFTCVGLSVSFNNTSKGSGISSFWMFGDGSTSTTSAPFHTYTSSGVYTVKLAVTDLSGCTDTLTQSSYITVNALPQASFTMSDTFAVCPPLYVNFTNTSTGATSYHWTFGDGTSSSATSPSDIYLTRTHYTIKLIAVNLAGCTDSAIGGASIFGYSGAFTYTPVNVCALSPVHFTATLSGVTNVVWDFNDGVVSTASLKDTISHSYLVPGEYVPTLLLTDSTGCTGFSISADTIKADTVMPHFNFKPDTICQNSSITFHDSSVSAYSTVTNWLWTFGSGVTSTKGSPAYTYTVSGTHPVTLQVADGFGCQSTITQNVNVNPVPAIITGDPSVCTGQTTALSDVTGGGLWSSSNTAIATVATGIVSGLSTGTSTITYQVPTGCYVSATITDNPLPKAIKGPTSLCIGSTATLSDATSGGNWSSSNITVAPVDALGSIVGVSAGTVTITYALGSGCAATITVTVNTTPGTISDPSALCTGMVYNLSDAVGSGTWSSSNTIVATINVSGVVSGSTSGTATITYTAGSGCTVFKTVTVISTPSAITGASQLCPGAGISLSDVTGSGKWSSSITTVATVTISSGLVFAVSAGTTTISYVTGTSCAATKIVTVDPLPPLISGPSKVCLGQAIILSDAVAGGGWISSNTTIATVDPGTGVVTSEGGGTVKISYILTTGCLTATNVTVNLLPFGIIGTTHACAGQTTTLSDIGGGSWNSSNTAVATVDPGTGVVTGMSGGTTTISYTIGGGCPATVTVTIDPIPSAITGTTHLCAGFTTTLSDGVTGTWSSSNTGIATIGASTGLTTGISTGTATITFTSLAGCLANIPVSVNPLPSTITGAANICAGLTTTLSDTAAGGAWSSSNTGVATAGAGTGIVKGITAGTATITYSLATGCFATKPITINPQPGLITGVTTVCVGLVTNLSDPSVGGSWSSSNTSIAGVIAGTVTGLSAGADTIVYTLSTGCKTEIPVTINPLPHAISGTTNVCIGLTTALSDIGGGAWRSSNTVVATIGAVTGILSGATAGTTTVTYTLSSGCVVTAIATVSPIPGTMTGITHVCAGSTTSLSDTGGGTWTSSATSIATVDGAGIVTGVSAGTAMITYTTVANCAAFVTVSVYPVIAAIAGATNICIGLSTTLSDATPGGLWSSSNTVVATINASGVVTGVAPGSAAITYTVANSCGTADTFVTVTPLPEAGAISGKTTICTGFTTQLTETVTGGVWGSSNNNIAGVDANGLITAIAPGAVTVSYTYTNSCGSAVAKITLDIQQSPNIARITTHPDSLLCANTLFQNFGADTTEPPGITYMWSADNAVIYATAANGQYCLISFTSPGTSIVKLSTEGSSDCVSTDSLVFNINTGESPDPVVVYYVPEFVCNDNTANSFQWGYDNVHTLDSTLLPGEVNENYYNPNPDFSNKNYWVMTYHNGCLQKSYYNMPTQVNTVAAGNNLEISVFPNPADAKINMEVKGIYPSDMIGVKLFDMIGREIKAAAIEGGKGSIKIAELPSGAYMLVFSKNGIKIGSRTFVRE